jgi:F-type H+-transporting ATPase subunit epsilon
MALQVEVVSPEGTTYTGEAETVVCRTVGGGDIAFQAGHIPFIGELDVWQVEVIGADGRRDLFAVHRGFVQIARDVVTVLSDVSETREEIDVARAEGSRAQAAAALAADPGDEPAATALRRAELRLRVAGAPTGGGGHH